MKAIARHLGKSLFMTNASGLLPMEFNCVVQPDPVEEVSPGGIILRTAATAERDKLAVDEGTLIAVSPLAFTYAEWGEHDRKPQVGDRVVFARYAGALYTRNGIDFRLLKDKDISAIVVPELSLAAAA